MEGEKKEAHGGLSLFEKHLFFLDGYPRWPMAEISIFVALSGRQDFVFFESAK
jgi:hypothetical protein